MRETLIAIAGALSFMVMGRLQSVVRPGLRPSLLVLLVTASWCAAVRPAAAEKKCGELRILAIGDSITKGSVPSKKKDNPYLAYTKEQLESAVGSCFDVSYTLAAQGGAGLLVRNGKTISENAMPTLRGAEWDWVLIMAGINDLLAGAKTAQEIWEGGLRDLYDQALAQGAHVLGMLPLPTALVDGSDPKERERKELGRLIYSYSRQNPRVKCLYYGVNWSEEQKAKWLDKDKLHLTEEGHKELGSQVYEIIRAFMGRDPCTTCRKFVQLPGDTQPARGGFDWSAPFSVLNPANWFGGGFRGFSLPVASSAQCGGSGGMCFLYGRGACSDAQWPGAPCPSGASCRRNSASSWTCS